MQSWINGVAYGEALKVKKKYLDRYRETVLEKAVPGTTVENRFGECHCIEGASDCAMSCIDRDVARRAILGNLRLLRGIGPGKEAKLKAQGYATIEDLLEHPRWRGAARRFISLIDSCDACLIQEELWHWLPKSHPLNLHITAFAEVDRMVVIDIETMGLFSRPIFLFGAACVEGGTVHTRQFLARDIDEEPAAMEAFCSLVADRPIVSYNGRAFDVPYVNQRRWYYDMRGELDNLHFDMLHFARRLFRLPDARLTTVEKHLFGGFREDDVPGALVPEFYEAYLRTGNPGPLVPVIEHNRRDLIALARLYAKLCEEERCHVCR